MSQMRSQLYTSFPKNLYNEREDAKNHQNIFYQNPKSSAALAIESCYYQGTKTGQFSVYVVIRY